jgi:hypothetical protein
MVASAAGYYPSQRHFLAETVGKVLMPSHSPRSRCRPVSETESNNAVR